MPDFMDNWYPCTISFDGMSFPSLENAFQATRFAERDMRAKFMYMPASEAAYRGPLFRTTVPGWRDMRYEILYGLLCLKFSDPVLQKKLIGTGNQEIKLSNLRHENDIGTCVCSRCRGRGNNAAGLLLEKIRSDLQRQAMNRKKENNDWEPATGPVPVLIDSRYSDYDLKERI